MSLEEGQRAARLAALNCLAEVRGLLGSLDRVATCRPADGLRRLRAGVRSAAGGHRTEPRELIEEIFGEVGQHARSAIGVAELPGGAPVEVELIVEVRPEP